jgi:hypothetical protein
MDDALLNICELLYLPQLYGYIAMMLFFSSRGCRGRDRMVDGITTAYAISAYHH